MTLQGARENLGPFDPQIDPSVLDCRDRGLGNARQLGELVLAQLLQLAQDTERLADGDLGSLSGRMELAHRAVEVEITGRRCHASAAAVGHAGGRRGIERGRDPGAPRLDRGFRVRVRGIGPKWQACG